MNKMNYRVVRSGDADTFQRMVEQLLEEGWQLAGGISVNTDTANRTYYYQALTKGSNLYQDFFG